MTIKNANKDSRARIEYVCGKSKSSGTKKKLNYNYKEVSNQLLRAKKPQGAANALTKAKSRLATLQRYAATGEYDSKEISAAVAHARRMVECAQLKVRHLKQEEIENRKYKSENKSEVTQKKGEIKRRAANKERELKAKTAIEQTLAVVNHVSEIKEQALGNAINQVNFESFARYEAHLDRKYERTLAMLIKLKSLSGNAPQAS